MTGEWLFSVAAFREGAAPDDDPFLDVFTDPRSPIAAGVDDERRWLTELRHDVLPRFVEDCAEAIDWGAYRVVGFTSTFQQNVASLALACQIRQRHPDVTLLFGGANFEDDMGPAYLEAFDWVDYAILGEADSAFGDFLGAIASGRDPLTIPGVAGRVRGRVVVNRASSPVRTMDDLPVPQYDEYFERVSTLEVEGDPYPLAIPFESSVWLLVGSEAPLHLLRVERRHDVVPLQIPGPCPRGVGQPRAPLPPHRVRGRRQHPRHELSAIVVS